MARTTATVVKAVHVIQCNDHVEHGMVSTLEEAEAEMERRREELFATLERTTGTSRKEYNLRVNWQIHSFPV